MVHTTNSEKETQFIAAKFATTLKGGEVVYLKGDLGSGKTAFVRGVVQELGFEDPVRSPTFTIVNRYLVDHPTIKQIIHVDLYRIEDPSELIPLALEEELGQTDTVTFIEWPERGEGNLLAASHTITFQINDDAHIIQLD